MRGEGESLEFVESTYADLPGPTPEIEGIHDEKHVRRCAQHGADVVFGNIAPVDHGGWYVAGQTLTDQRADGIVAFQRVADSQDHGPPPRRGAARPAAPPGEQVQELRIDAHGVTTGCSARTGNSGRADA